MTECRHHKNVFKKPSIGILKPLIAKTRRAAKASGVTKGSVKAAIKSIRKKSQKWAVTGSNRGPAD